MSPGRALTCTPPQVVHSPPSVGDWRVENALEESGVRADSESAADRELHVFVEDSLHDEREAPDWRAREKAGKARARRVSNLPYFS